MNEYHLGEMEAKFAGLIWDKEPLSSGRLAELAQEKLNWKRSTTYTVLRRLCDRGLFQNQNGTVTSLVSREEFNTHRTEAFLEDAFDGSLPAFLTAFCSRKKLTDAQIDELQTIINGMRG